MNSSAAAGVQKCLTQGEAIRLAETSIFHTLSYYGRLLGVITSSGLACHERSKRQSNGLPDSRLRLSSWRSPVEAVKKAAHLMMDTNDAMEVGGDFPAAAVMPVGWAHFTQSQDDLTKTFALLQKSDRLQLSAGGTLVIDRAATLSQRILHTHSGKKALR